VIGVIVVIGVFVAMARARCRLPVLMAWS